MKHTFRTICLALLAGVLAGAAAATYVLAVDTHSKIGLEFDNANRHQRVEVGHLNADSDAVRALKFWGLKVGYGNSLTAIGVYHRPIQPHAANQSPRLPE